MLSVNQLDAQIKLNEAWKAVNLKDYPRKWKKRETNDQARSTRAVRVGKLLEQGRSNITSSTFTDDAVKAWNKTPEEIKNAKTFSVAKVHLKKIVKALPI